MILKFLRARGLYKFWLTGRTLSWLGVVPVIRHYYEPFLRRHDLRFPLNCDRAIGGLDLNIDAQLALLERLHYADELRRIPITPSSSHTFGYENRMFEGGDSEFLYCVIRHFKPNRIIEVGAGQSTLMTSLALAANQVDDSDYQCDHLVVEPFENHWLEDVGVNVLRSKVEDCERSLFESLRANDILFVDTSHVIRPQGDVLHLFLDVFGRVQDGVLIHVHDIFTPRDYPEEWLIRDQRLWNEQYLLEAFLSFNSDFEVIGAVNHLWHSYPDQFLKACPMLPHLQRQDPGSFWFRRKSRGSLVTKNNIPVAG